MSEDVVERLRALGIPDEAIARAVEQGDPEGAIFDAVVLPEGPERCVSPREIEEQGGISVQENVLFLESFGLPAQDPDHPAFTEEEARVLVELGSLREVFPPELGLQIGRVYGRLLARIAQTEVQLFRVYIAPRLAADADHPLDAMRAVQEGFARLMPLADPLILGVHRRWLERELANETIAAAEGADGRRLPGAVNVAFLFCDLKDFTAYANSEGDAAAVAAIDRFAAVVTRERGEVRMTKGLGDGFMLVYGEACDAVEAGIRVIRSMRAPDMPGVHSSVHAGVAILREGDYFGTAVNLAARLLAAAGRDELVATRAAVDPCGSRFDWEPAGTRRVKGVSDPVEILRLTP